MSRFLNLVSIADDGPWCGTKPPGPPRPHALEARTIASDRPAEGPSVEIAAAAWHAVQLYQIGQAMPEGGQRASVQSAAAAYFDDWCGTVPFSVLVNVILHPPAPWPFYLENMAFAANVLTMASSLSQGSVRSEMTSFASKTIEAGVAAFRASSSASASARAS